jgi:hypothetical protein
MRPLLGELINKDIDNGNINANNANVVVRPEFPKPFEETKWVVMSSCLFLIPAVYAFVNKLYLCGVVSLFAGLLSINHWRNAENGFRRAADCYTAYICFLVYGSLAFIYCRGIYYKYCSLIYIITVTLFLVSNHLSIQCHPDWCFIHALFHLFAIISKCLVIYFII